MRGIWILVLINLFLPGPHAQKYVPREWEPHEALWLPCLGQTERGYDDSVSIPLIKKCDAEACHQPTWCPAYNLPESC